MTGRSPSFTQLELERYLLGDLPPERAQELQHACMTDPELCKLLDDMRLENKGFSDSHPFQHTLQRARASAAENTVRTWSWMPVATAVALVLAIIGSIAIWNPAPNTGVQTERLKGQGQTSLLVYRQSADEPERLQDGGLVRDGDVLQIAYTNYQNTYGAILSVDGSAQVTVHLPTKGLDAAQLASHGTTRLPFAYQLDDAPEYERFYLFWQSQPFDIVLLQALLHTQDLTQEDMPVGMHVQILTLHKE